MLKNILLILVILAFIKSDYCFSDMENSEVVQVIDKIVNQIKADKSYKSLYKTNYKEFVFDIEKRTYNCASSSLISYILNNEYPGLNFKIIRFDFC